MKKDEKKRKSQTSEDMHKVERKRKNENVNPSAEEKLCRIINQKIEVSELVRFYKQYKMLRMNGKLRALFGKEPFCNLSSMKKFILLQKLIDQEDTVEESKTLLTQIFQENETNLYKLLNVPEGKRYKLEVKFEKKKSQLSRTWKKAKAI